MHFYIFTYERENGSLAGLQIPVQQDDIYQAIIAWYEYWCYNVEKVAPKYMTVRKDGAQ